MYIIYKIIQLYKYIYIQLTLSCCKFLEKKPFRYLIYLLIVTSKLYSKPDFNVSSSLDSLDNLFIKGSILVI